MSRPLIDPMEANYSLDCETCDESLSDEGNNLTKRQASARALAHLKKNPGHEVRWSAIGAVRGWTL